MTPYNSIDDNNIVLCTQDNGTSIVIQCISGNVYVIDASTHGTSVLADIRTMIANGHGLSEFVRVQYPSEK